MSDVYLSLEFTEHDSWTKTFRIEDAGDSDRVIDRLEHEHGGTIRYPGADAVAAWWVPRDDPDEQRVFTWVPLETTFAEFRIVFGPALDDESAPVKFSFGAAGGFDNPNIVPLGWAVKPFYFVIGRVIQLRDEVAFAKEREGTDRWRNTGVIDSHLIDDIRAHGVIWDAKVFSRRYDVSDTERGELLREAGYEWRYLEVLGGHYWYDKAADSYPGAWDSR